MVQDMYGSAEVMQLRDIDKPEIGDHDVLGHARAAGVNPADLAVMSGLPFIACPVYGLRKPATACVHVRSRIGDRSPIVIGQVLSRQSCSEGVKTGLRRERR
jgi:hypothetical protein